MASGGRSAGRRSRQYGRVADCVDVENVRYNRNVTVVFSLTVWPLEPVSLRGSFSAEKRYLHPQRSLVLWGFLYTQGPHESLESVLNVPLHTLVSDNGGWSHAYRTAAPPGLRPSVCVWV